MAQPLTKQRSIINVITEQVTKVYQVNYKIGTLLLAREYTDFFQNTCFKKATIWRLKKI